MAVVTVYSLRAGVLGWLRCGGEEFECSPVCHPKLHLRGQTALPSRRLPPPLAPGVVASISVGLAVVTVYASEGAGLAVARVSLSSLRLCKETRRGGGPARVERR